MFILRKVNERHSNLKTSFWSLKIKTERCLAQRKIQPTFQILFRVIKSSSKQILIILIQISPFVRNLKVEVDCTAVENGSVVGDQRGSGGDRRTRRRQFSRSIVTIWNPPSIFLPQIHVIVESLLLFLCRNGFQKLEKIKDSSRKSRQLEELTEKMRECKGYFSSFFCDWCVWFLCCVIENVIVRAWCCSFYWIELIVVCDFQICADFDCCVFGYEVTLIDFEWIDKMDLILTESEMKEKQFMFWNISLKVIDLNKIKSQF